MELAPGESVIFEGRPSWRAILGFYIMGLLIVVAVGVAVRFIVDLGVGVAAGVGAFLILLLVGWLKRIFTKYTITTRRLRVQRGVISRSIQETRIDRLQDHSIHQTFIERMLRVGTIDFDTAAGEQGDMFRFAGIDNPERVILQIDRVTHQSGAAGFSESGEGPLPPPPAE